MEFELDLKNLVVPVPQYRYFSIERPARKELGSSSTLLGKRSLFSCSLFDPMQQECQLEAESLKKGNDSQELTRDVSTKEEPLPDLRVAKMTS